MTNPAHWIRRLMPLVFGLSIAGCGGGDADVSATEAPLTTQPLQLVVTNAAVDLGTPVSMVAKLRQPATDANGNAHVGVIFAHPFSGYADFQGCTELARRGFTTLCIDTSFTNKHSLYYGYEQHVPAIRAAVNYLRKLPGVTKVILLGHSQGGPLMAFYQNVAENGPSVCSGPEKLIPCVTTNLVGLPPADGLIVFDSHLGDSLATFTYVDPAVINNTFGQRDPSLDMFSAANGYNLTTNGASYTPAFKAKYFAAQAARNTQLNNQALALLAQKRAATGDPTQMGDDIPFPVVGATAARLFQPDLDLLQCTQKPQILLSHDGTRPKQIVCSVRPPSGGAAAGLSATQGLLSVTVHAWLGANALRSTTTYAQTKDDLTGIDFTSTAVTSVGNIPGVTKPLLIVANSGHYFLRPDEILFDAAKMADKTFALEEGSVHGGTECSACETQLGVATPSGATFGYFGDTFSRTMDYMGEWMRRRY